MILDPNALSAWVDGDEALAVALTVVALLSRPVIALGEYRYGLLGSRQRGAYAAWLDVHLPHLELLPVVEKTTRIYAKAPPGTKGPGSADPGKWPLDLRAGAGAPAARPQPRPPLCPGAQPGREGVVAAATGPGSRPAR
jgi:hypothetical protein